MLHILSLRFYLQTLNFHYCVSVNISDKMATSLPPGQREVCSPVGTRAECGRGGTSWGTRQT